MSFGKRKADIARASGLLHDYAMRALILLILLVAVGCSEQTRVALFPGSGEIDHGTVLGVRVGATLEEARAALTQRGLEEGDLAKEDHCVGQPFRADAILYFYDMSWRRGVMCVGISKGRVVRVGWLYNFLAP